MKQVQMALGRVLEEAPGSIRELARASGVSHVTLLAARDGRLAPRPETVYRVAEALRSWGRVCDELAEYLEEAQQQDLERSDG